MIQVISIKIALNFSMSWRVDQNVARWESAAPVTCIWSRVVQRGINTEDAHAQYSFGIKKILIIFEKFFLSQLFKYVISFTP